MIFGGQKVDLETPEARLKEFALPPGVTCEDCFAFHFCTGIGVAKEGQTLCDWYPVRFRQAPRKQAA
jgi:hypothetical protein